MKQAGTLCTAVTMDLAGLQGSSEQSKESEQVSSLAPQLLISLYCHLVR